MDSLYAIVLSPWGRVALLSLVIGLATQGIKGACPKGSWVRAFLPLLAVLLGVVSSLLPDVLTGPAPQLLGAAAGAFSTFAVEQWHRYKDQATTATFKKLATPKETPP